jgi:hypothetical protein
MRVPGLDRTRPRKTARANTDREEQHVRATRLQNTRRSLAAQLAETLAYKVHVHSHHQIPPDTAQHHQTRPSVMPSLKRRGLGLSLGRGDLMDPLPTKCVLLGSEPATMDSAKMPTRMRSEVCKGQVSALSTRCNCSVKSSSFSIVNSPYPTQSAWFSLHHVCTAQHRAL